jgi:hypothetical protein
MPELRSEVLAELESVAASEDEALGRLLGLAASERQAINTGRAAKALITKLKTLGPAQHHKPSTAAEKRVLPPLIRLLPGTFSLLREYLPDADTMMVLTEEKLGQPITAKNLVEANAASAEIVSSALDPGFEVFLRETLSFDEADTVTLTLDELTLFLRENYKKFSKSEGSGLISRAGGYNEALFREALLSEGLSEGADFIRTGTRGHGDVEVFARGLKPPETLSVEIKSYAARERLLRGLENAKKPKVGAGFFTSASEFNSRRTHALAGTGASAIYLPQSTLEKLPHESLSRQNSHGGLFYRPIDRFATDMRRFTEVGELAFSEFKAR